MSARVKHPLVDVYKERWLSLADFTLQCYTAWCCPVRSEMEMTPLWGWILLWYATWGSHLENSLLPEVSFRGGYWPNLCWWCHPFRNLNLEERPQFVFFLKGEVKGCKTQEPETALLYHVVHEGSTASPARSRLLLPLSPAPVQEHKTSCLCGVLAEFFSRTSYCLLGRSGGQGYHTSTTRFSVFHK